MIIINYRDKVYFAYLLIIIIIVLLLTWSIEAADIELTFSEVELITDYNQPIFPFASFDLNNLEEWSNQEDEIQGPYQININNVENNTRLKRLKLEFEGDDLENYQFMSSQIKLQYLVITDQSVGGNWSSWTLLRDLPLTIDIQDFNENNAGGSFFNQIALFIRFAVPQSLNVRCGLYHGVFNIEAY